MLKVSVVVPIYNVEDYISQCLDSVLSQTLVDIEIICIDDCGKDNSISIVEDYQKKDSRIKLIRHEQNQGLGGARNTGIKLAQGQYIYFIDSDDYIAPTTLEECYSAAEKNNVKIVDFDFIYAYEDGQEKHCDHVWNKKNRKAGFNLIHKDNFFDFYEVAWNKLYAKEIFEDKALRYLSHVRHEDYEFYWKLFTQHQQIFVIKKPFYYYRQRGDSIIGSIKDISIVNDYIKVLDSIYSYLDTRGLFPEYNDLFTKAVKNFYAKAEYIKGAQDAFIAQFNGKFQNMNQELSQNITPILNKKIANKWLKILKYLIRKPFCLFKQKGRTKIRSILAQYDR